MPLRKNTDPMVDYILLDYPNNMHFTHVMQGAFVDAGVTTVVATLNAGLSFTGAVTARWTTRIIPALAAGLSFTADVTARWTTRIIPTLTAGLSFTGATTARWTTRILPTISAGLSFTATISVVQSIANAFKGSFAKHIKPGTGSVKLKR